MELLLTEKGKQASTQGFGETAAVVLDYFQQEGRGDALKASKDLHLSSNETIKICGALCKAGYLVVSEGSENSNNNNNLSGRLSGFWNRVEGK